MLVKQIMTKDVVSVSPDSSVRDLARLLIERRISGVPVVDAEQRVVGIVSEGDLLFRAETGARRPRARWLSIFVGDGESAADFIKSHARRVSDLMTRDVVSVSEDATVSEVAGILAERHVKRLPVLRDGRLVGIVSRADLVRALALAANPVGPVPSPTDEAIRDSIESALRAQPWAGSLPVSVVVTNGVVHLWGMAHSEAEREASRVLAESIPGVERVESHLTPLPAAFYAGV
jgi:CBS domain-containing protein